MTEAVWPSNDLAPVLLPVYHLSSSQPAPSKPSSKIESPTDIPSFIYVERQITEPSLREDIVSRSRKSSTGGQDATNLVLRKGRSEVNPTSAGTLSVQFGGSQVIDWTTRALEDSSSVRLEPMDIICVEWSSTSITNSSDSNLWSTFKPLPSSPKVDPLSKSSPPVSLVDCLTEFTKPEDLSGDNAWYCSTCQSHQPATKTLAFWKTPDILVIHLKRFSSLGTVREKIDALVEFPVAGLDLDAEKMVEETKMMNRLEPEDFGSRKRSLYDLFAVSEHVGSLLGSGHYKAYAHNHEDDQWYHFSDDFVEKCEAKDSMVCLHFLALTFTA